jgi:uncharacterized membrane protein
MSASQTGFRGHEPGRRLFGPADPDEHVARTVEEITQLEGRDRVAMGWSDHVANGITAFSGSMLFVWLHVVWFVAWILLNIPGLETPEFDPFPFGFLTMVVSLEAIFLSTFVLISQNRQSIRADRRSKVDLQVNLIAEQEVTKLIQLVAEIHDHLGLQHHPDHEVQAMRRPTYVKELADAADQTEEQRDPEGAEDPQSAADTE